MKVVTASANGQIVLDEIDKPRAAAGCVTIRNRCSLISPGTELHYLRRAGEQGKPMTLGYCCSGVVEEVGLEVYDLRVGDEVVAMGWGAALHAEYVTVPQRLCQLIPKNVPHDRAVFAALACTAFHSLDRIGGTRGETMVIVGAGLVGQLIGQVAQMRGIRIGISDPKGYRVDAGLLGGANFAIPADKPWADLLPEPVDCIALALSGRADEAFAKCVDALRREPNGRPIGRILIVGRLDISIPFSVELGNIDILNSAHAGFGYRDMEYVCGRISYPAPSGQNLVDHNLAEAIKSISTGSLRVDHIHTHCFPFENAALAYELLQSADAEPLGVTLHYPNAR